MHMQTGLRLMIVARNAKSAAVLIAGVLIATVASSQAQIGGQWTTLTQVPDPRTEVSATSDGASIYFLGGYGVTLAGQLSAPKPLYVYDPALDVWSHIGNLPEGSHHAGLAYLDGSLYVIGGYLGPTRDPTARMIIYDIAENRWSEGPPMPTARGALAVVALNGHIHAIGGELGGGAVTGAHEVYDPVTDTWAIAENMPTPREHLAAAVVGNQIVVMAGRDGTTSALTTNEVYDATNDSWHAGAGVPTGRSGIAAVGLNGHAYLFGGEEFDDGDRTFDAAERYDPATNSWELLPPMPTARHGLAAAAVNGLIYVLSGGPRSGLSLSRLNERFSPN